MGTLNLPYVCLPPARVDQPTTERRPRADLARHGIVLTAQRRSSYHGAGCAFPRRTISPTQINRYAFHSRLHKKLYVLHGVPDATIVVLKSIVGVAVAFLGDGLVIGVIDVVFGAGFQTVNHRHVYVRNNSAKNTILDYTVSFLITSIADNKRKR